MGDVLHYQRGSKTSGIGQGSCAQVVATDPKSNLLTVENRDGRQVTYDPSRLHGISAYRELEREFAVDERLQFTVPNKQLGVASTLIDRLNHKVSKTSAINPGKQQPTIRSLVIDDSQLTTTTLGKRLGLGP